VSWSSVHVDQRRALHVAALDGEERRVDAARLRGHGLGVVVHRRAVQHVQHRDIGRAAGRLDVGRDRLERLSGPARQEDPRPLAGEGPRDAAADAAAAAVHDGVLVLE
jgi:hypothetical protein